jgi:hypothetical protein
VILLLFSFAFDPARKPRARSPAACSASSSPAL